MSSVQDPRQVAAHTPRPIDEILTAAARRPETFDAVRQAADAYLAQPSRKTGLRVWRAYVLALSPGVKAHTWHVNGHDLKLWYRFDESVNLLAQWEDGFCLCGCGKLAKLDDAKIADRSHYFILWRRLCRVLLGEIPPSAVPWPAIDLAHKPPRALLSDDEFRAVSCLYFSDHDLP